MSDHKYTLADGVTNADVDQRTNSNSDTVNAPFVVPRLAGGQELDATHGLPVAPIDAGDHTATALTDASNITTAATGMALRKGIVKIFADVWNSALHLLRVSVTDGTNTLPTMDAPARAGYVEITDGVHSLPTGDTSARAIHVAIDADNTAPIADPLPVQADAGENHIGEVGGPLATPAATFTRPADATAYASGDLVADNTAAASVTPMAFTVARVAGGSFMVRRAKLKKSGTSTANATFRLHLFTSIPNNAAGGLASGDNAALVVNANGYLGAIDLDMTSSSGRVWADSATVHAVPNTGSEISAKLASGQVIYGLLEARGAYTPASGETFTATLEVFQN